MDNQANNGRIDYLEFPATDVAKTKAFYQRVFGWKFTDYGPDYTSFEDGRIAGGFTKEGKVVRGGPLVVLYASDLAATEKKVREAGGVITKDAFPFPVDDASISLIPAATNWRSGRRNKESGTGTAFHMGNRSARGSIRSLA